MFVYTYPQLLLFGCISGLVLSLLLLAQKNNFSANKFLALFISSLSLMLLHQYLIESDEIQQWPNLTGIILPLEFVLPPALYLYIRIITISGRYKSRAAWHFIPAVTGMFLLIPFYTLDFTTKLNIIKTNFDSVNLPGLLQDTFPIFFLATAIQLTIYFFLWFKLLFLHGQKITQYFLNRSGVSLAWLRNFLIVLVVSWILVVILNYFNIVVMHDSWIYLLGVFVVIYVGIMGLLQARIYKK